MTIAWLSEEMILQNNLADSIALIRDGDEIYQKTLSENLNRDLWSKILIYKGNSSLSKTIIEMKNLLKSHLITQVFIPNAYEPLSGGALFHSAKKMRITINQLEEGINPELRHQNHPIRLDLKLKRMLYWLIKLARYSYPLYYYRVNEYKYTNRYTFFPNLEIKTKTKTKTVKLSFNYNPQINSYTDYYIFLSRPVENQGCHFFDDQINVILDSLNRFERILIKFHPRDSVDKRNKITKALSHIENVKVLDSNISAERFLQKNKVKGIIGYYSNTMLIFSSHFKKRTFSYVGNLNSFESKFFHFLILEHFKDSIIII
jgi:hypothetical protein